MTDATTVAALRGEVAHLSARLVAAERELRWLRNLTAEQAAADAEDAGDLLTIPPVPQSGEAP